MKNLFNRRSAPGRAAMVKQWVMECRDLGDSDLVTIAELACHEPGCPPLETVVTVHLADGERRMWHIHQPLAEIDQADIVNAMKSGS